MPYDRNLTPAPAPTPNAPTHAPNSVTAAEPFPPLLAASIATPIAGTPTPNTGQLHVVFAKALGFQPPAVSLHWRLPLPRPQHPQP
eukprot:12863752-Alexandrium_andersonii.AAC.1